MTTEYRQPTEDEAVRHLRASLTQKYRDECVKFWRERFGDPWVDRVLSQFNEGKANTGRRK